MAIPTFYITHYIENFTNSEDFRKELFSKNIMTKDYEEEGLMLVYHKYDQPIKTNLERECRSIVIDKKEKKIISYSCETPLMNKESIEYMISHPSDAVSFYKCYEGSLLSVFHHNDKWYVSTRRCLNSNDSVWGGDKSHLTMFSEVLNTSGYSNIDEFTNKLDKSHCYYFVLIHHNNNNLVDYTSEFGKDYKKLCLVFVREKATQMEINMTENEIVKSIIDDNIFLPMSIDSLEHFDNENKTAPFSLPPKSEGIIVRIFDSETNKYKLLKLQTMNYQFAKSTGTEKNIFKGLIHLYQTNQLVDFFKNNTLSVNYKKIVNPINTTEAYDTVGMIDSVFKVMTSELFELFKILYDIKTGKPKTEEKELYDSLPKEYKDMMYMIRGIYYKKKAGFITNHVVNHLQIDDIYQLLKNQTVDVFCALLRTRRLMFNWVRVNPVVKTFGKISVKCDKVQTKLIAIYTNKLFPEIMQDDYPVSS